MALIKTCGNFPAATGTKEAYGLLPVSGLSKAFFKSR